MNHSDLLVSVIIVNYNYGNFISSAIDSALAQTYKNIEVIVVDDGSTDNSREVIEQYSSNVIRKFKKNGGQASAFNAGFELSSGDIICFLDSDDYFKPDKIEKIIALFKDYPKSGWVFHQYKNFDNITNKTISIHPPDFATTEIDFTEKIASGEKPTFAPATSSLCFRRAVLEKILPMPEASGILIADNYIKYVALYLYPGYFHNEILTGLRIHKNNNLSLQEKAKLTDSLFDIYTSFHLLIHFPGLFKFTHRLFGIELGKYWKNRSSSQDRKQLATTEHMISSYLSKVSLTQKVKILLRAFYHYQLRDLKSKSDKPYSILKKLKRQS